MDDIHLPLRPPPEMFDSDEEDEEYNIPETPPNEEEEENDQDMAQVIVISSDDDEEEAEAEAPSPTGSFDAFVPPHLTPDLIAEAKEQDSVLSLSLPISEDQEYSPVEPIHESDMLSLPDSQTPPPTPLLGPSQPSRAAFMSPAPNMHPPPSRAAAIDLTADPPSKRSLFLHPRLLQSAAASASSDGRLVLDRFVAASPDVMNPQAPFRSTMSVGQSDAFMRLLQHSADPLPEFMHPSMFAGQGVETDYVWSVKMDGNRALWDGFKKRLYGTSRETFITPPRMWWRHMPADCILDGELFRPSENRVNGTVSEFSGEMPLVSAVWRREAAGSTRSAIEPHEWLQLQFLAFDVVNNELALKPLNHRLAVLEALTLRFHREVDTEDVAVPNGVYHMVPHRPFIPAPGQTKLQLLEEIQQMYENLGAEGIVLKEAASKYVGSRTGKIKSWLKVKFYDDIEAVIQSKYEAPKLQLTKKKKLPGVIIIRADTGQQQSVQFFGRGVDRTKLRVGDIVKVSFMKNYDEDATGEEKLRTPRIVAVLFDRTWEQIQLNEATKAAAK